MKKSAPQVVPWIVPSFPLEGRQLPTASIAFLSYCLHSHSPPPINWFLVICQWWVLGVSDQGNGLSPVLHQAITQSIGEILLIGPWQIDFESKWDNFLTRRHFWKRRLRTDVHFVQASWNNLPPNKTHQIPKLKWFSSPLVDVFAQSIEARSKIGNEDVVGAAPTGDAPTTSEWSTIVLLINVRLMLEIWRYMVCCPSVRSHHHPPSKVARRPRITDLDLKWPLGALDRIYVSLLNTTVHVPLNTWVVALPVLPKYCAIN